MYLWRRLTDEQRREVLEYRLLNERPRHSPQHQASLNGRYLLTAACYEHRHIIGLNPKRMGGFCGDLVRTLEAHCEETYGWCVLPNHYHVLILTRKLRELLQDIGRLHGRTAFDWNGEDGGRGRKVWFNCAETGMKSDRHFWATLNYIHHNAVHHGYVKQWQDWPFSSSAAFLEHCGRELAAKLWKKYPIHEYGKAWDPPEL